METSFSQAQLEDPELAEADRILRTCNHYGFCTATCPTYVLLGDELDAPRGRIDLMHAMLAKSGPPDADTVARIDRCLSCLACMTTCAVNVDYMHLVDIGRAHIEKTYRRPIADRLFRATLAFVLPHPRRLRAALLLARLAWPFRNLLPDGLRVMLDLATQSQVAHAPTLENKSGGRSVALLPGCVQDVIAPGINAATARLLARVKIGMTIPNCGCCGSLTLHMGREDEAKAMARRTIDALWAHVDHIDAVLVTASGCGTTVKDYAHLLRDDAGYAHKAARISSLAKDVSEFLHGIGIATNLKVRRAVAYHDACSMRNAQKVTDQPRELLRSLGFEVRDVPENQLCCGSAGTYNILQPAIAAQLGRRKADHVLSTHAPVLAVGNIGCITQLRRFLGSVPVVHTVELVDWATGGPVPASLAGFNWPELPEECENAAAREQVAGFW
jgi:glycolate oxidase iron-sulfur subunit